MAEQWVPGKTYAPAQNLCSGEGSAAGSHQSHATAAVTTVKEAGLARVLGRRDHENFVEVWMLRLANDSQSVYSGYVRHGGEPGETRMIQNCELYGFHLSCLNMN